MPPRMTIASTGSARSPRDSRESSRRATNTGRGRCSTSSVRIHQSRTRASVALRTPTAQVTVCYKGRATTRSVSSTARPWRALPLLRRVGVPSRRPPRLRRVGVRERVVEGVERALARDLHLERLTRAIVVDGDGADVALAPPQEANLD